MTMTVGQAVDSMTTTVGQTVDSMTTTMGQAVDSVTTTMGQAVDSIVEYINGEQMLWWDFAYVWYDSEFVLFVHVHTHTLLLAVTQLIMTVLCITTTGNKQPDSAM